MGRPTSGYRNDEGQKVVGVTTILNRYKDSGGLLWWAFKQGQAAERGEINSLYDKRDEAADSGTLAHDLVESDIKGTPPPEIPENEVGQQARQAFKSYELWRETNKIEIIATELPLVSEKYQYGGTPDAIGRLGKKIILLDWKTSKDIYTDYVLQLAAYAQLVNERTQWKVNGGGYIARFSKTGGEFSVHYYSDLKPYFKLFLKLLEAYRMEKELK